MSLQINYADLTVQKHMLSDRIRCQAYRRALADLVTPDSVVLDAGAGTGLLSLFAAQAGARMVYAVERTDTAALARDIIADNALSERIRVYQADLNDVELPEPVDVIVSEFMGGCGFDENVLPAVIRARDRWLKPSGTMIPRRLSSWLAPVYDDVLDADVYYWQSRPYGINLGRIGDCTFRQVQPCRYNVYSHHLFSPPQQLWSVDIGSLTHQASLRTLHAEQRFVCQRSGRCNALAAWFEADLSDNNVLSNRPSLDYTHWGRWVLPIGASVHLEREAEVQVQVSLHPEKSGQAKACWQVAIGDYSFSSADVTRLAD